MAQPRSSLQILQDPYFQLSLALAKGAAAKVGAKKLSALLLLVGVQLAQRSPGAQAPQAIAANREAIEHAASQLGLDPVQEIAPATQGTLPLSLARSRLKDVLEPRFA